MIRHWLLLLLIVPLIALADHDHGPQPALQAHEIDRSLLDSSGIGYNGVLSINQAAGSFQQQSNARALAIGQTARATTNQQQNIEVRGVDRSLDASSEILGPAFTGGNGALGVNQSAGAATQQANAMNISLSAGPKGLADSELEQSVAFKQNSGSDRSAIGARRVVTDDQAFAGSNGVVQLNQSAGVGNRMANTLNIRIADRP
ncbi:hypothetical protein D9M71_43980 [compost metagenome]